MVVRPVVLKRRQVSELEVSKMKTFGLLCGGTVNAIVKKMSRTALPVKNLEEE